MDEINEPTFKLKIQGVGCFKHDRGDLWWAGVSDLECISHLHNAVCDGIRRSGLYYDFERQDFKFSPHITLARKVITKQNFDLVIINRDIKAISTQVEKIVLMDSEYVGGILSYTSVYEKQLF
jgi:2'-5' RNA ligase